MKRSSEDLIYALKVALATSFSFYMKAHNYHINVTGSNFSEYHEFFGDIYEEVWSSVDKLAEEIRTLDSFAPFSYTRFMELSACKQEAISVEAVDVMFQNLISDNATLLETLYTAHRLAGEAKNFGTTSNLEVLIAATQKRHWMLTSYTA